MLSFSFATVKTQYLLLVRSYVVYDKKGFVHNMEFAWIEMKISIGRFNFGHLVVGSQAPIERAGMYREVCSGNTKRQ